MNPEINREIERLGGTPSEQGWAHFKWPEGLFNASANRIRELYPKYSGVGEYEIFDDFHPVRELKFVASVEEGFWDDWRADFESVDPSKDIPFASDEAYFFFIHELPNQKCIISCVDHETSDEAPFPMSHLPLARLLATLEKIPTKPIRLP